MTEIMQEQNEKLFLQKIEQTPSLIQEFEPTQSSKAAVTVGGFLTIDQVVRVARNHAQVKITDKSEILEGVQASCDYINKAVDAGQPIYGVTSGFGGMANVAIRPKILIAKDLIPQI